MFSVRAMPYSSPTAMRNTAELIRLSVTYFSAPSIWGREPPSASSTKLAISITSNQTYRLNRSPVRNAPHTPASKTWNSGK